MVVADASSVIGQADQLVSDNQGRIALAALAVVGVRWAWRWLREVLEVHEAHERGRAMYREWRDSLDD